MGKFPCLNSKLLNWFLFLLLSLIWGSSFILMKAGMQRLSPYQVATLRIFSAGLILIPFSIRAFRLVPREKLGLVILSGLLGNFFPAYLFCLAETQIDSAIAGILNALTPFFTILLGIFFFGMQARAEKMIGIAIGFIGLCLLLLSGANVSVQNISYSLLVLVATLFYAINVNMVGRYLKGIGSLQIASVAFVCLLIPTLILLLVTGYFRLPLTQKEVALSTLAACVLGIMGTAVASILFYMLMKRAGTLFASMVTYGIPFVAVFWGVWDGEKITGLQMGCMGIILGGVYLVNRKPGT